MSKTSNKFCQALTSAIQATAYSTKTPPSPSNDCRKTIKNKNELSSIRQAVSQNDKANRVHSKQRIIKQSPKNTKNKSSPTRSIEGISQEDIQAKYLQKIKYKRFSKILKQKYLFFNENESATPTNLYNQKQKINHQLTILKVKKLKRQSQNQPSSLDQDFFVGADKFSLKLKFKQRPSSGFPMKRNHASSSLKSKENPGFNWSQNVSLELKHIDALSYDYEESPRTRQTRKSKKGRFIYAHERVKTEPVMALQQIKARPFREDSQFIDPWEYEPDKLNHLSQIDISLKPQS